MLGSEENEELRALQRKAYGRQGGLTRTEASRLGELQKLRDVPEPAPAHEPQADEPCLAETLGFGEQPPVTNTEPLLEPVAEPDAPTVEDDPDAAEGQDVSLRALLRRFWRSAAVVGVVVLAVGVGVGWALFGARASGPQLTAEQQQRGAELAEQGDFDPGSFRALGRDEEAVAWYGTKGGGRLACISLIVEEQADTQCTESDGLETFGLSAQVMMAPIEDEEGAVIEMSSVGAYIAYAPNGDPVAIFQRWDDSGSAADQFSGGEQIRAEELIDQGYNGSLMIVGYFQDKPVWTAERYVEDSIEPEMCLIVDGIDTDNGACVPSSEMYEGGIGMSEYSIGEGGETVTSVELGYTTQGMPYLTVTDDVATDVFDDGEEG